MNDRFKEIVDAELEKWQQPEEKMTIRDLLLRVAERVEEQMLDAVEVGRHMGQLMIERNEARAIAERCYSELDSIKRLRIGGLPWRKHE